MAWKYPGTEGTQPSALRIVSFADSGREVFAHRTDNRLRDKGADGVWSDSDELVIELPGESFNVVFDALALPHAAVGVAGGYSADVVQQYRFEQRSAGYVTTHRKRPESVAVV